MGRAGRTGFEFGLLGLGHAILLLPGAWPAAALLIAAGFGPLNPGLMALHLGNGSAGEHGRTVARYYLWQDAGFTLAAWILPVTFEVAGLAGLLGATALAAAAGWWACGSLDASGSQGQG